MKRQTMFATVFIRGILLLLIFSLLGTSCRQKAKYEKGDFGYSMEQVNIGVRSDKNVYDINDVTMDWYYSFFDLEKNIDSETGENNAINIFSPLGFDYNRLFFAAYLCNTKYLDNIKTLDVCFDYKNIEGVKFLKEISMEEALSKEYGSTTKMFSGRTYNHSEKLVIPAEVFENDPTTIYIVFVTVAELSEEPCQYKKVYTFWLDLYYSIIDDQHIEIYF